MYKPENCKKTEGFEGSLHEQIGLSPYVCPRCGAHLKETGPDRLICLNACHLGEAGMQRFADRINSTLGGSS